MLRRKGPEKSSEFAKIRPFPASHFMLSPWGIHFLAAAAAPNIPSWARARAVLVENKPGPFWLDQKNECLTQRRDDRYI